MTSGKENELLHLARQLHRATSGLCEALEWLGRLEQRKALGLDYEQERISEDIAEAKEDERWAREVCEKILKDVVDLYEGSDGKA